MNQNSSGRGGKRLQKQNEKTALGTEKRPGGEKNSGAESGFFQSRAFRVLTIIAAVIVAAFVFWHFFSAAPNIDLPDRPQTTTVVDDDGNLIEVPMEGPGVPSDQKKEFYTFLLVGQDTYGGGNTDTMMLVAYDVPNQALNVMSLPRDTYVNYNGRKVLLNSVYNRAGGGDEGIAALKKEVGELTGVTPYYHVIVQWEAVGKLVDAIDGVDFNVPRRMYYNDLSQNFKIDLQPGMQHLDGDKAMQLIRWRHNSDDSGHILNSGYATGDLGRIETQQDFLKAIIKKCLQPGVLLPNLGEYVKIFQENVVTDLTASNLAFFVKSAVSGLDMDNVEFFTMPYREAGDGAHLLPAGSELLEIINEKFNPYKDDLWLGELDLVTQKTSSSSSGSSTQNTGSSGSTSSTPKPSESVRPAESEAPAQSAGPNNPLPPPETSVSPSESVPPAESQAPAESEAPAESQAPVPSAEPVPSADPEEVLLPPGA